MATPQDLTTTVSGRRCTRSRARTAATSSTLTSSAAASTTSTSSTISTTSTTAQSTQAIETTSEAPPPPPPPATTSTTSTSTSSSTPPPDPLTSTSTQAAAAAAETTAAAAAAETTAAAAAAGTTAVSETTTTPESTAQPEQPATTEAPLPPESSTIGTSAVSSSSSSSSSSSPSLPFSLSPSSLIFSLSSSSSSSLFSLSSSSSPSPSPSSSSAQSTETTAAATAPSPSASLIPSPSASLSSSIPPSESVEVAAVASEPESSALGPQTSAIAEAKPLDTPASASVSTSVPAAAPTSESAPASASASESAPEPQPTTTLAPISASTSSDAITAAATSTSTTPLLDSVLASTSAQAVPDTTNSATSSSDSSNNVSGKKPLTTGVPSGSQGGAGQSNSGDSGLTLSVGQNDVAGIAGGVVGGVVGLALIGLLLFFCLRRRKTDSKSWNEKKSGSGGSFSTVKDKFSSIPAGVGLLVAKLKGKKAGPVSNPYRRHTVRSSVGSVYSVQGNGRRSQSISEPPMTFRQQLRGFGDRMPSLKRSRSLLGKKQDSLVVGSKSPFPGIVQDPVLRNSNNANNPFNDPLEPPRNLFLLNPDPSSRRGSIKQGPVTPEAAAKSERPTRDPFASIIADINALDGSGTPEWARDGDQHNRSSQAALGSHPTSKYASSSYTASIYDNDNPFFDPSDVPPMPNGPSVPNTSLSKPASAYAPMPAFNTTSTISRESDVSFYYGEPGPSRPTTNAFGNKVRQSDPFDLDRPEVLSFGSVGRPVRGSTMTSSTRKRGSSIPNFNWMNTNNNTYDRTSAVPTPLNSKYAK